MSRNQMAAVLSFSQLMEQFVGYFQRVYGEVETQRLATKVYTSKKADKFISETKIRHVKPGTDDYINVIHSSTSFVLLQAEKISFVTIMLLHKWNIKVGIPYNLADDYYLNKVMLSILGKCDKFKTHTRGQPNFFDRFFLELDNSWALLRNNLDRMQEQESEQSDEMPPMTWPLDEEELETIAAKPLIAANDNIENYRYFANKTLFEIDEQYTLVNIKFNPSPIGMGFDGIIIETSTENILFPFIDGFDQSDLQNLSIGECIFRIVPTFELGQSPVTDDCICFGHPNDFLN